MRALSQSMLATSPPVPYCCMNACRLPRPVPNVVSWTALRSFPAPSLLREPSHLKGDYANPGTATPTWFSRPRWFRSAALDVTAERMMGLQLGLRFTRQLMGIDCPPNWRQYWARRFVSAACRAEAAGSFARLSMRNVSDSCDRAAGRPPSEVRKPEMT